MPRKYEICQEEREPPKKRTCNGFSNDKQGDILMDLDGKKWKLGKALGIGGFGEIYEATNISSRERNQSYVAKLEKHSNGPLFVEVNCYLRIAKLQMIEEWKETKKRNILGMPHYVASGSHYYNNEKYRFLILPKYKKDLEKVLNEKKRLSMKTVLIISLQILDVLEYIHNKGYIHSDIKASNIMLETRVPAPRRNSGYRKNDWEMSPNDMEVSREIEKPYLRKRNSKSQVRKLRELPRRAARHKYIDDIPYLENVLRSHEMENSCNSENNLNNSDNSAATTDQAYLLDYGLASKYLSANGNHKPFCTDERKAHAGTVLFCSRDAHMGVTSRRSDLESLGYNIIFWLTGELPWLDDLTHPVEIDKKKNRCFKEIERFLQFCFHNEYPQFVWDYFNYLNKLKYEDCPNYDLCRRIFRAGLKNYGYDDDSLMDLDETCNWQRKLPKKKRKQKNPVLKTYSFLLKSPLKSISSNVVFKRPKLRKSVKRLQISDSIMNWSRILTDPENILKQARERKNTEESEDFSDMDIEALNPTYAMINVYNKAIGRTDNSKNRNDSNCYQNIGGYTPAMMQIHTKMKKHKQIHYTVKFYSIRNCGKLTRKWDGSCSTPPVLRSSRILAQY